MHHGEVIKHHFQDQFLLVCVSACHASEMHLGKMINCSDFAKNIYSLAYWTTLEAENWETWKTHDGARCVFFREMRKISFYFCSHLRLCKNWRRWGERRKVMWTLFKKCFITLTRTISHITGTPDFISQVYWHFGEASKMAKHKHRDEEKKFEATVEAVDPEF